MCGHPILHSMQLSIWVQLTNLTPYLLKVQTLFIQAMILEQVSAMCHGVLAICINLQANVTVHI